MIQPGGTFITKEDSDRLRREFDAIDSDKNGFISKDELMIVWQRAFAHLPEKDAKYMANKMIKLSFVDDDGRLNFDDFVQLCIMDPTLRFDVCFVRYQKKKAEDQLGLALYLPFIILFVIFLVSGKGLDHGFYFTASLMNDLSDGPMTDDNSSYITFRDVGSTSDFWMWVDQMLIPTFWQPPSDDTTDINMVNARSPVFGNQGRAIGALKIRQHRITSSECETAQRDFLKSNADELPPGYLEDRLNDIPTLCYPDTDDAPWDEKPYPNLMPYITEELNAPWVYRTCAYLNGSGIVTGKHGQYDCAGYAAIIPFSMTYGVVRSIIDTLKFGVEGIQSNGLPTTVTWIDDQTRAVHVEFIVYNQHVHLFARLQFLVEFSAGGAVIGTRQVNMFQPHQWVDHNSGYWLFFFIFFLWVVSYTIAFMVDVGQRSVARYRDTHKHGLVHIIRSVTYVVIADPWIMFDALNLGIFIAVFAMRFTWMSIGLTQASLLQTSFYPGDYESLATLFALISQLDAINAFLTLIRIFYFLQLNSQMNILTKTVGRALPQLVGIMTIFAIIFAGFALMSFVAFGHVLEDYRDMPTTISTLSRMVVGDSDYVTAREERRIFTGVFYVLFIIVSIFLLLNMVIAVLSSAFDAVQGAKFDFSQITRILDMSLSDTTSQSIFSKISHASVVLEIKYWVQRTMLLFRGLPHEEHEKQMDEISAHCPRMYWARVESELLRRRVVMNFKENLHAQTISLQDHIDNHFGGDMSNVQSMLVQPAVQTAGFSERNLILDMVEFHHSWNIDVEKYAEVGELPSKINQSGSKDPNSVDGRVDLALRRLERMQSSRKEVIDVIKKETSQAVSRKMNYVVHDRMKHVLKDGVQQLASHLENKIRERRENAAASVNGGTAPPGPTPPAPAPAPAPSPAPKAQQHRPTPLAGSILTSQPSGSILKRQGTNTPPGSTPRQGTPPGSTPRQGTPPGSTPRQGTPPAGERTPPPSQRTPPASGRTPPVGSPTARRMVSFGSPEGNGPQPLRPSVSQPLPPESPIKFDDDDEKKK